MYDYTLNSSHSGIKLPRFLYTHLRTTWLLYIVYSYYFTDKQKALRRECTFKIEKVLEIGVAGVNLYLKRIFLTLSDVLARLPQLVRPWRMVISFYQ